MKIKRLRSLPPGSNPFDHDLFQMGSQVAPNLLVMYSGHGSLGQVDLVNPVTGERVRILWDEQIQAGRETMFADQEGYHPIPEGEPEKPCEQEVRLTKQGACYYTLGEFKQVCEEHSLMDGDGFGEWCDDKGKCLSQARVKPSAYLRYMAEEDSPCIPYRAAYVCWHNK